MTIYIFTMHCQSNSLFISTYITVRKIKTHMSVELASLQIYRHKKISKDGSLSLRQMPKIGD